MYVTRRLGKKHGPTLGCPGCATIGSYHQASHSDTCRNRRRTELEKGEESILPENKHGWMQGNKSNPLHHATSEEWDRPPEKCSGEWDEGCDKKTGLVLYPVQAEDTPRTSRVNRPGNELPMSKQKTWKITSNRMQMKVQRHSLKRRRSLLMKECSVAIGNTSSLKTHNQHLGDKVGGDGYLGLEESMDITTGSEQGVQWDFTNVKIRNQASMKIVAEKRFLLIGAHPCANWRPKANASRSRMTEREILRAAWSPSTHAVCLSHVPVAAR